MANKSFAEYMKEYAEGHRHPLNKLTHMFGIPIIVASLPVLPFNPLLGGALFVGGWILQFIGHYGFEHNDPKLFGDPLFSLIGVVWVAVEWARLIGIELPVPGVEHTRVS